MYLGGVIVRRRASDHDEATVPAALARYRKMRFTKHLWLISAAMVAAAGLSVPAASASGTNALLPSCGAKSYPFTPWGDLDAYCAFPNLGFESGKTAWTLT